MRHTKTISEAESVAQTLKLQDYATAMVGNESVIIVDQQVAKDVCEKFETSSSEYGKDGKWCLTNLSKFLN